MRNTALLVIDVQQLTGFGSARALRRAFVHVGGDAPSACRKGGGRAARR